MIAYGSPGNGLEQFKAFRDLGETFNYLGRECVVRQINPGLPGYLLPRMLANYCNNDGVIRDLTFELDELPVLIKQNGGVK